MKTRGFLATALVTAVFGAVAVDARPAHATGNGGRFALLVGSNLGDRGEAVLRHAEEDAARLAQTLRLLGDFPSDQVVLMTGPTASELRDSLIRLNARVREHRDGVLLVFYSGHADEQTLHLTGTRLPTAELKTLLVGSPAVSRLLIVDACRSGSLIRLKGAQPAPSFVVPALVESLPEGFAVLTSSAASEDSHESAALGSSYFTYYVNSGLIGGADQNRDNAVTLSELYAFASTETRAATANSWAGPQNPTFQFALGGQHDLVLTRLGRRDLRLGTLRFPQAGRYLVQQRTNTGLSPPVAEVAAREAGTELALAPGPYRVTLRGERDVSQQDLSVRGGDVTAVDLAQMVRIDVGRIVRKGGPRSSATGFTVAAGWHGSEIRATNLVLGSGPNLMASVRHDRKWFSAEARLGLDRATFTDARGITFDNRAVAPTALVLLPFDWSAATVAVGVEAGIVFMHQSTGVSPQHASHVSAPVTAALLGTRWARGLQAGPVVQIDAPLGPHTYLRLEGALIWRTFAGNTTDAEGDRRGSHLRLLAGVGVAF